MAPDDTQDKDLGQLDEEIEEKVDSLFVEEEKELQVEQSVGSEEDPLKSLKEHFLALEWEIDRETLEKITREIKALEPRYSDGPMATLLGWMREIAERIGARGSEVDQATMGLFHRIKDGFLKLAEDPSQDPSPILDPLKEETERLLGPVEEEEPTITLETAAGEEELLFEELDRIMEETPAAEEAGLSEEEAALEFALEPDERPVALQETVEEEREGIVEEEVEDTALESAEEFSWEEEPEEELVAEMGPEEELVAEAGPEEELVAEVGPEELPMVAPSMVEQPMEVSELEALCSGLGECGTQLQQLVEDFQGPDGPASMTALLEDAGRKIREFSGSLQGAVASLQEKIKALEGIDKVVKPVEPEPIPEPIPEPEVAHEEVLFVSVSNRIFGIPLLSVKGIFRVPGDAVPQVVKMTELDLKGKTVPLIPLWRKLGLGRDLYAFPKEEKRVLLVSSVKGEWALLVDRVLAREEVAVKPVKEEEHGLFKGLVIVEKWAFVVDPDAL